MLFIENYKYIVRFVWIYWLYFWKFKQVPLMPLSQWWYFKIFSKPKRPLVTLWTMDKGYWDSTVMRNPSRPLTFRISHPTTYPRGTTCFMAVISLTWSQEQIFHRTGTDSTIFILSKPSWKKFSILALACF